MFDETAFNEVAGSLADALGRFASHDDDGALPPDLQPHALAKDLRELGLDGCDPDGFTIMHRAMSLMDNDGADDPGVIGRRLGQLVDPAGDNPLAELFWSRDNAAQQHGLHLWLSRDHSGAEDLGFCLPGAQDNSNWYDQMLAQTHGVDLPDAQGYTCAEYALRNRHLNSDSQSERRVLAAQGFRPQDHSLTHVFELAVQSAPIFLSSFNQQALKEMVRSGIPLGHSAQGRDSFWDVARRHLCSVSQDLPEAVVDISENTQKSVMSHFADMAADTNGWMRMIHEAYPGQSCTAQIRPAVMELERLSARCASRAQPCDITWAATAFARDTANTVPFDDKRAASGPGML